MLTEIQCKNAACPAEKKRVRFTDANGLYLEVSPAGSKRWFWKTYADGKEGRLALGSYPDVTLKSARLARDAARRDRADGIDPVQARKLAKLKSVVAEGETFKATAEEWYGKNVSRWSSHYAIREKRNLEKDLYPYFADRRVSEIEPVELLAALRRVEERGALDVAGRVLQTARAVWRYAVSTARAPRDITGDLKGALTPHKKRHFAAITDPTKLGELIRVIRGYQGGPIVRTALQLAPLLFQRPNELRGAAWAEIDLDKALWTVPAVRMKRRIDGKENGDPHLVPLPTQAVDLLRKLHPLTGRGVLVFPGERSHDRPISDNTLRAALLTLGYGPTVQTVHGFRATARTLLAEVLEVDPLVIEAQLAHAVKDANGRAYNRTQYVNQRSQMIQRWADYLDALGEGSRATTESTVQAAQEAGKRENVGGSARDFSRVADADKLDGSPTKGRGQLTKERKGGESMAELFAQAIAGGIGRAR